MRPNVAPARARSRHIFGEPALDFERLAALRAACDAHPTPALVIELIEALLARGDRPEAIEAYRRLTLADPVGARDAAVRAAYERALWSQPGELPTNLPAARRRLVGRDAALAELEGALREHRFVALLGPGGIGKTRLALEVARRALPEFRDGVWWVDLTAARSVQDLHAELARVLALTPSLRGATELASELGARRLLIVFDRCEGLAEEVGQLGAALLAHAPGATLLTTTQRAIPLAIPFEVSALALPAEGASRSQAAASEAVALFVERAVEADPRFALNDANARAVAGLCRALAGSPFAIEAAAAYLAHGDLERLTERLASDRAPEARDAARASVAWVYRMLGDAEARLLRALGLFPGDWSIDDAENVLGADAVAALDALLDAGLVVTRGTRRGLQRYRLLDATRDFARAQLDAAGELDDVRARFLRRIAATAAASESLASLSDHVLLAFDIAAEWTPAEPPVLELAGALELRLATLEHPAALHPRLDALVRRARARGDRSIGFADALGAFARLVNFLGDHATAVTLHDERIAVARACADPAALARALAGALPALLNERRFERVRATASEALAVARACDDTQSCADALRALSAAAHFEGDVDGALQYVDAFMQLPQERIAKGSIGRMLVGYFANAQKRGDLARGRAALEAALAIGHAIEDYGLATHCEMSLGFCAQRERRLEEAHQALQRAVSLSQHGSNTMTQIDALEELAAASIRSDQLEHLARVLGAIDAMRTRLRLAANPYVQGRSERLRAIVRAELGADAYALAYAQGGRGALPQAIEWAAQLRCGETLLEDADRFAQLSRREREIAQLVAEGVTNRAIARRLSVSVRTVDTHVASILRKLGVAGRGEIAARL